MNSTRLATVLNPIDISEFWFKILSYLEKDSMENMRDTCTKMYLDIFSQAIDATESAAKDMMVTPESMFPDVYATLIGIAETVFMPIAGIILVCVLSYECVNMMAESNRMKEFGPQDVFILILKMLAGVLLLTHSFDLVNTCFKIGQWAVIHSGLETGNVALEKGLDVTVLIEESTNWLDMVGYMVLGTIMKGAIGVFGIVIKVAVWLRFVELYMFVVSAPLPFATFLNKEWGQIGFNYIRKILSLAFQPVYMILCFSIFTATLIIQPGSDFTGTIMKSFASMFILTIALFKTSSIADSIFNAH